MYFVYLILMGIVSGTLGGMGMGGGTLLIPLLTIIFNFNQRLAQGINLISFSLMAIFIVFLHIKNGLINIKTGLVFALFSVPACILGAVLVRVVHTKYLKMLYGALLILIAIIQTYSELKNKKITKFK